MVPNKQAEEAIVPVEMKGGGDQDEGEEFDFGVDQSMSSFKSLIWHGGSVYDAWFSCASNQVAQVLLTLPYSFSQLGMLSGIVLQVFYGLLGSWTAYLISILYVEYRSRKEKEKISFKNHVIQWFEVLDGLLGPYWKAVGLAFNCTFLLFGSVIQLIACASNIYYINDHLDKRTWTYIFGACCATTVFIPSFHNYRIWSFLGLGMTTYTAWYMTIAAFVHGQVEGVVHSGPTTMVLYFTGATNILYTFGGHAVTVEIMHAMWKPQKFKYIYLFATFYVFTLTLPSAAAVYWAFDDLLLNHANAFSLLPKKETTKKCNMAGDTANDLLSAIAQKVITSIVDAIGHQFGYLFFYKRNNKNLEEKVKKLENSRDNVNKSFKAEIRNNKEISQSSTKWLSDVDEVTMAANRVGEAKDKLKGGCLNLKSRYVLSKKSTKLAMDIRELQEQAPILVATNPALPAGMLTGSSSNYASMDFKSRTKIVNNVMGALNDDTVNIIGICGLGGIGKITILQEVRERAITEKLFVEVSMATVSQDQNLFKIQSDLEGMLGLIEMKNVENIIARTDLLHKRLTSGSKILVILDDVWSEIELKKVGIPVGNDRTKCKVIRASSLRSVCTSMRTQETILVDQLPKEEAWQLFKREAGDCVEKEKLEAIAKEVGDECGGLPIALITLASALSNKKREVWEDACKEKK